MARPTLPFTSGKIVIQIRTGATKSGTIYIRDAAYRTDCYLKTFGQLNVRKIISRKSTFLSCEIYIGT